jgi:serine protease AprX
MSIRVVNLSLSSGSPLPPAVDPLAQAVETLWAQGLTVVVAAGNDGPDAGSVSSPGNDPVVLTVGALDDAGTTAHDDDSVASWSSRDRGAAAKPELLAPGAAVVSLRAPGSVIDAANPGARVGSDGFRGSGTSMSAAVTSGAVAALLAARPQLTPDDVKALVSATAYDVAGSTGRKAAGGLDLTAALGASVPRHHGSRPDAADLDEADAEAWFALARAWAAGDYDAAARAWALMSPQARAWAARAWAARAWAARAWAGRAWADEEWAGGAPDDGWLARAWAARAWTARAWAARAWSGRAWADEEFAGRAWAARAWSARAWSARAWSARAWSARAWSGRAWADEDWAGRAWAAEDWAARAWSARAWSARAWSARAWG